MNPNPIFTSTHSSGLEEVDNRQSKPVRSQNLDIVSLPTRLQKPITPMEIESLFGIMVKQVSLIGESCRNNLTEARARIAALEDKSNIVNEALDTLVTKDMELTTIMKNQATYNEVLSQAVNWLRTTMEAQQHLNLADFQRLNEMYHKVYEDTKSIQSSSRDILSKTEELRNTNIRIELLEEQMKNFQTTTETQFNSKENLMIQMNSQLSKLGDLEKAMQRFDEKLGKVEDRTQLNEGRTKELQRCFEELPKLREGIKGNTRDFLGLEEDTGKLKRSVQLIEDKLEKNNSKKLTKAEKSIMTSIETEIVGIQEKLRSLETVVEHLNDVKFEDFGRRFKKELFENNEAQVIKISKNIFELEEQTKLQSKTNESLQKNLQALQKKIDNESLKIQDLKFTHAAEEKWSLTETRLEELSTNLETLLKKSKQHDYDILGLSENVYDYSFREMASSFDERVDNRLTNIKQQIKDVLTQVSKLNKTTLEENNSNILLNKVQKMVENKIEAHVDLVDQKLMNLASKNSLIPSVPASTENGKEILYKIGNSFVDPDQLKVSINGTVKLKDKCIYGAKCDRVFCKRDHGEKNYPQGMGCKTTQCDNKRTSTKDGENSTNNRLTINKNETRNLTKIKWCKSGDKCPNVKCSFQHDKEPCGGFKVCKKVDCRRRHHPSRGEPQPHYKKRKSINKETPSYSQQPLYMSQSGHHYPFQLQSQYFSPYSTPWYGSYNMYPTLPNSFLWCGESQRQF